MPEKATEPKFLTTVRLYAIYFGTGAVVCTQAIKFNVFSLPPAASLYAGYFFSCLALVCLLFAGGSAVQLLGSTLTTIKKIREIDKADTASPADPTKIQ